MDFNALKEKIGSLSKQKKMSVKAVLEKAGISVPGFYQAINKNSLRIDILESIARVLDIPLTDLLSDSIVKEDNRPFFHAKNNLNNNKVNIGDKSTVTGFDDCMQRLKSKESEINYLLQVIESKDQVIATKDQLIYALSK